MIKEIVQIGTPILTQTTKPVSDVNSEHVKQTVTNLLDTCNANRRITAGLAAPQINHSERICIVRRVDLEDAAPDKTLPAEDLWEVLINPEVTEKSEEESVIWEACLSIGKGKDMLYGPVSRPDEVTVKFLTPDGKEKQISGSGFFSHVIQHEIDHLNGILFLQYVNNPANIWKSDALDKYMDEYGDHPPIL